MPVRTMPAPLLLAWALLAAAPAPSRAQAVGYALDPVHTRVAFLVDHAGFSKAIGTLSGATGTLHFDPDDWTTATLRAEIPLARLDLGDTRWNEATLARGLLDAARHPVAVFTSTRVEPVNATRARVHGQLALRGVAREVVLDVVLNAARRHPMPPFRRTVGFSATTTLSRAAFGVDGWPSMIGDAVELRIEVEATRSRAAGEPPEAPAVESADVAPPATEAPQAGPPPDAPAADPEPLP